MSETRKQQLHKVVLVIASLAFVAGFFVALRYQPLTLSDLSLLPTLCLVFVTLPINFLLNGLEFQLSARLAEGKLSLRDAVETTVIGSAANLLPIPGGAIVKVARLKALGVSYKHGISTTLYPALLWLGTALTYAGLWASVLGVGAVSWAFVGLGAIVVIGASAFAYKIYGQIDTLLRLLLVRVCLVILDAIQIFLCMLALAVAGSFAQASLLTVSGVLGSAVSIVPAGLGVREAVSAVIGPFVGLTAASAYLVTAVNRLLSLAAIAPLAFYLAAKRKGDHRDETGER